MTNTKEIIWKMMNAQKSKIDIPPEAQEYFIEKFITYLRNPKLKIQGNFHSVDLILGCAQRFTEQSQQLKITKFYIDKAFHAYLRSLYIEEKFIENYYPKKMRLKI